MAARIIEGPRDKEGGKANEPVNFVVLDELAELPWLGHAVSTRRGGVSKPPYDSLNLGLFTDDETDRVRQNYKRFAEAAGFDLERLICCRQIHGDRIHVITEGEKDLLEEKSREKEKGLPLLLDDGDGLITNLPNRPIGIFTADCYSVFLVDKERRAIGACHAGWKGTILKVTLQLLRRMTHHFNTDPKDVTALIGPGIGKEAYEVGDNVIISIRAVTPYWTELVEFQKNRRWQLDLREAQRRQLLNGGIPAEQIHAVERCTHSEKDLFFSHRRDGVTGRMLSVFWIK